MSLNKESVLHIACGMIVGKVHRTVHVPVILHLRTFGKREAHAREDVHNLVLHNSKRMASTKANGIRSAREIKVITGNSCHLNLITQLVDALQSQILQFIDAHTHFLLHLGRHQTEVGHKGIELSFLTKVFNAQSLHFLGILCTQILYLCNQSFYLVNHVSTNFPQR